MTSSYGGVGYSSDPAYRLSSYLATRFEKPGGSLPDINLEDAFNADSDIETWTGVPDALKQFITLHSAQNRLPITIDGFVQAFYDQFNLETISTPSAAEIKDHIKELIIQSLLQTAGLDDPAIDGTFIDAIGTAITDPTSFKNDLASRLFEQFLRELQYDTESPSTPLVMQDFNDQFSNFLFHFATISEGISLLSGSENALNFQDIYNAYFVDNPTAFEQFLTSYVSDLMYPNGAASGVGFLPSEEIGNWYKTVQESYSKALSGAAAPLTSSVGESFKKVLIIDKIYQLIVEMIGTLQQVAAAQSDRLRILTEWQSAYTTLQTQIHTFTKGDGTSIDGTSDDEQEARDALNSLNQTYTENIRSRRSILQDEAKSLQSSINNSNDAANQQSNLGTAIIQELSTILGAIYR